MRKLFKIPILLFILSFLIYNLNFTTIGAGDTIPSRLLPFNILEGNGIYFDKYYDYIKFKNPYEVTYYFIQYKGHYISSYPIIGGLLSLIIYLPFFIYLKLNNLLLINYLFNLSLYLEKLSASFFASLSVSLVYLLILKLSRNFKLSVLFALAFAFGSQNFSISSQALWQHTSANLFFILSQFFLIKRFFILALIFAIFTFYSRLNFFLYLFLLIGFLYFVDKKNFFIYFVLSILGVSFLGIYNLYFYNSLIGGYSVLAIGKLKIDVVRSFLGILLSPSRGVLFYTPFFLFGLFSLMYINKIKLSRDKIILILNFFYLVLGIILNSIWGGWWGGHTWGNRLLTDIAVSAIILCYFFYVYNKSFILKSLLVILILYSVFIQSLGVFVSTKTMWNTYPTNIDLDRKRLWDFYDNPIARSLKVIKNDQ